MGYAVYAIDRTVLSSVLVPLSASLSISNSELGLLSATQYIGVTCTVFIAGTISDLYGRWKVILAGLIIFTAFTWLIGISTSFIEAFSFRLISGFGEGMFWPVAMATVADFFRGRKGLAMGIFYVGFDTGSIAGLSIGGITYSISGNWRLAFLIAPLVGIFVIGGVVSARNRLSQRENISGPTFPSAQKVYRLLRRPNMALLMVFALLATWSSVWQVVFLPYYFFKVMHFTVLNSALLSSLVMAAGACGKVILGGVSDSTKKNRFLVAMSFATLVSYTVFFFDSGNISLDLVGALSMGFFSASLFPLMQVLVAESAGTNFGSALGLSTSFQSVATIFSPIIAAALLTFGVGRSAVIDAMLPIGFAVLVALFLKRP